MKEVAFYAEKLREYRQRWNKLENEIAETPDGFNKSYCITSIKCLADEHLKENKHQEEYPASNKERNVAIEKLQKRYQLDRKIAEAINKLTRKTSYGTSRETKLHAYMGISITIAEPILIKVAKYAALAELQEANMKPDEVKEVSALLKAFIRPLTTAVLAENLGSLVFHPQGGATTIHTAYLTGTYVAKSYLRYRLERQILCF